LELTLQEVAVESPQASQEKTIFTILAAISFCHLMNDMVQSLIPSLYPMLKSSFRLSFTQLGLITLSYQMTASLLQPVVGYYTDKTPRPYSLPVGMGLTLIGLLFLSVAPNFSMLLLAASLVGVGSAIFHPESSRLARLSSGGKHGFAQSVFQVGGNTGSAVGPLMAALIVLPRGQHAIAWFSVAALVGIIILLNVGHWYKAHLTNKQKTRTANSGNSVRLSSAKIAISIAVLIALIFSKFFYLASLTSYYTFYLISKFHVSVRSSQIHLFIFLAAVAAGTIVGGPIGDRFGRKLVIWCSILGVLPFTLLLPYANLFWTGVLSVVIGLILASAFSAILVYAQELVPGRIGMVSGLFFGFAFGIGGVGAALLGKLADMTNIAFVYQVCSFLPTIGLLTGFLPNIQNIKPRSQKALV
jgi:FSR family fosmidomycin resistance protein-like MFS transporter